MDDNKQRAENALDPMAMREELINIAIGAKGTIKRAVNKREAIGSMVDEMLMRQMRFYSEMAEPEMTDDVTKIMLATQGLQGHMSAVLINAATVVNFMAPDVREKYQRSAAALRADVQAVLELIV